MPNQKSHLSIPPKWQEKFWIKRIDEEDILISLEERNAILESLNSGTRFVQIGKYTLMLNAIKSIDPYWGADNIPPRPKIQERYVELEGNTAKFETYGEEEQREWDKVFGEKQNKYLESSKRPKGYSRGSL